MKEQALKLADELDSMVLSDDWGDMAKYYGWFKENASPMIRKLVEEIDCLTLTAQHHEFMARHLGMIVKERQELMKPLSDEEIEGAFYKKCWYYDEDEKFDYYGFAREIEKRHGIK